MVTRRDVDKIKDAGNNAYGLARRDLEKLWATLPFGQPEACREILLQAVPGLVEKYGQMAAVAALEWYEQLRAVAPGLPAYRATLPPASGLQGEVVRASLGGLWETDETRRQVERDKVFNALNEIVEKNVKQAARDTVTYNARRDPAKSRYARVPSGEKTCAFCMILASRGFVYKNAETAGMTEVFHTKCDCQIVPEFGKGNARISGYDPDAMQEKYQEARKQAQAELRKAGINRAPTPGETAQQMRKLYADSLSDGKGVKRSNYVPRSGLKLVGNPKDIEQRWTRQQKLKSDLSALIKGGKVEVLESHELDFLERFEKLEHRAKWIPKDVERRDPTNDFYWLTGDNLLTELKCIKSPTYGHIKGQIQPHAKKTIDGKQVKQNFMIDFGTRYMAPKLRTQLQKYNQRVREGKIKRLFVLHNDGKNLEEIILK